MFSESKYTRWYYNIVERAKSRTLSGYTENHHIIPRCFGGGNGDNLVRLTAREHFICHTLLVKMTSGMDRCKMSYALLLFTRNNPKHQRAIINSHQYQMIRKHISQASSMLHKGKTVSQATRDRQRETKRRNPPRRTDEMKRKQSDISKSFWASNKEKMLAAITSPEAKSKQSVSAKARSKSPEAVARFEKLLEKTKGSDNGNAKRIRVTAPDGTEYVCHGTFQSFCKEHELPFSTMCHILHKTRSFSKGKTVGWYAEFADAS